MTQHDDTAPTRDDRDRKCPSCDGPADPWPTGGTMGKVNAFRREQADKAIARIEWCYRRGLAIPDVR